jgi:isopenicillin-N epimerase
MISMRDQYSLDPSFTLLNNGSVGAMPRPVLETLLRLEQEMEFHPGAFLGRAGWLMDQARAEVAGFLGARPETIAFVVNATTGLNFPIRSLRLGPDDEVLSTDHEYGALDRAWRYMARERGFTYINHPIPAPFTTPEALVDELWKGVTPRTRVIFFSHITSPTALIFPAELICRRAREQGILTVVDGAHAPGQMPLALDQLGADFYVGNLHKWCGTPKGTAFLYARPEVQHLVDPVVIGWPWNEEPPHAGHYLDYVQGMGTRDVCGFLAVPEALRFMREHHWDQARAECHALVGEAQRRVSELSGLPPLHPIEQDSWYAQMATAHLPDTEVGRLAMRLHHHYRIETSMPTWNGHKLIRISIQVYNSPADVDRLITAIRESI